MGAHMMMLQLGLLALIATSATAADVSTFTTSSGTLTGYSIARPSGVCIPSFNNQNQLSYHWKATCQSTTSLLHGQFDASDTTCSGAATATQTLTLPANTGGGSTTINCVMNAAGVTGYLDNRWYSASGCATNNLCRQEYTSAGYCNVFSQALGAGVTIGGASVAGAQSMKSDSTNYQTLYTSNDCSGTAITAATVAASTTCPGSSSSTQTCKDASTAGYLTNTLVAPTSAPTASPIAASSSSSTPGGGKGTGADTRTRISQAMTFGGQTTAAAYVGVIKSTYETAYGRAIGIYDTTTNAVKSGSSVTSTVVAARRAATVTFVALVAQADAPAAQTASLALNANSYYSALMSTIQDLSLTGTVGANQPTNVGTATSSSCSSAGVVCTGSTSDVSRSTSATLLFTALLALIAAVAQL